jgi:hypothetical protein
MIPEHPRVSQGKQILLSVVVIGRNEGDRLGQCLQAVANMDREGFEVEVIYVDSGSMDGSIALAKAAGVHTISLISERPSAALGRNAGWQAASGTVILFLDGDTVLHPRFVCDSLPEFASEEIAVIWGHRRELYPRRSFYNRTLDLDWIYKPGLTPFCGGDALFRRHVLEQTGGFNETLIAGEEPDLCRRIRNLGYKILHVDRPMTGHDLAIFGWEQYWKRAVRAGHAYAEVSERSRGSNAPLWQDAARGNRRRALVILGSVMAAIAVSALLRDVWPLLAVALFLATLSVRSAWLARWKSDDVVALLLYGAHSHLQQIPIYMGQLQYRRNQRKGRRATLIEYKKH